MMDVKEAIRTRRSVGKVKQDPVAPELIEQILEAGVWAPNHHYTEPWRFFVMTGEGRRVLGHAYAEIAVEGLHSPTAAELEQIKLDQEKKAFRAPVVIAVAVSPSTDPKVPLVEELAAVHAAVQNMLLMAHALGLGAVWRSGAPAYHPIMQAAFKLSEKEQLTGFIYLGHPNMDLPQGRRTPFADKTTWLDQ
ncbi:MAG: nitroreductase [Paenibacillus sp.]|jgi:nitroreductase|nr:nitroreductase [Paenibacillus sp.]